MNVIPLPRSLATFDELLDMLRVRRVSVAVIGLGYVGLPLAAILGRQFRTLGFDIDAIRVSELKSGMDRTNEVGYSVLARAKYTSFSDKEKDLDDARVYIVTVPTPVDNSKRPNLNFLKEASRMVGRHLRPGDIVVYESTVYPGCTEEECVPVLEKSSGLRCHGFQARELDNNQGFYVGYSPERINPGDSEHTLMDVVKITSGCTPQVAEFIDRFYASIVPAGTHLVSSIRVAEAAKVIENTQRDLNIALINELSMLFSKLQVDTHEVLDAAATKWNFLRFEPGLVGGHCIGVDPYYLTHKARQVGHHADVILAGRRINDEMGHYVAKQVIRLMAARRMFGRNARVLILGVAFKENCADLRNTRVVDLIDTLLEHDMDVDVYDPIVCPNQAFSEYGLKLLDSPEKNEYQCVILAVPHDIFRRLGAAEIRSYGALGAVIYDVKGVLPRDQVDGRL